MLEPLDPELASLVALGIDNLTKYNIVHFMARRLSYQGDAAQLAQAICLRPGIPFVTALEELAAAGILSLRLPEQGSPCFVATLRDEHRNGVLELTKLAVDSAQFAALMRRLTSASLRHLSRELLPEL